MIPAQWRELRERGLTYKQIGQRVGVGEGVVGDAFRGYKFVTTAESRAAHLARERAQRQHIKTLKGEPRCKRCRIILQASMDEGDPRKPKGNYCWDCRERYPERCKE